MTYQYRQIELAPFDLIQSGDKLEDGFVKEITSMATPFGTPRNQMLGGRAIKVMPLSSKKGWYFVSYSYFTLPDKDADESVSSRGSVKTFVVFLDQKELLSFLKKGSNWIIDLFEKVMPTLPKGTADWVLEDVRRYKVAPIDKITLPESADIYRKQGGVGLKAAYKTASDWVYMEEAIRSWAVAIYNKTKKLPSFSTLSPSEGEVAEIFGFPEFKTKRKVNEIEAVRSEKAYFRNRQTIRRITAGIVGTVVVIGLGVVAALAPKETTDTAEFLTFGATLTPDCATETELTPEVTLEVTEAIGSFQIDFSALEATAEVTPEVTAESTIEATSEITPEQTQYPNCLNSNNLP